MTKEKLVKLGKYAEELNNRLNSELPTKHKNRQVTYRAFLQKELESTRRVLEAAKLDVK